MTDLGSFSVESGELREESGEWAARQQHLSEARQLADNGLYKGYKFGFFARSAGLADYHDEFISSIVRASPAWAPQQRLADVTRSSSGRSQGNPSARSAFRSTVRDIASSLRTTFYRIGRFTSSRLHGQSGRFRQLRPLRPLPDGLQWFHR